MHENSDDEGEFDEEDNEEENKIDLDDDYLGIENLNCVGFTDPEIAKKYEVQETCIG